MSSRILLIDDDAFIHKIAQRQIGTNYELLHAHSAKEGLVLIDSKNPQLILLDVEMPDTTGYQLCQQVRAQSKYNHIAIVFLSSKSSEQDIMLGYQLGADDYIVKPFHIDVLLKKIKVLEQTQAIKTPDPQKTADTSVAVLSQSNIEPAKAFSQVMLFIEDTYTIDCLDTLAKRFFTLTNQWGLNCSVMFSHTSEALFFTSNNVIKPLEKEIMLQTQKNSSRTLQFGHRMIVNYSQVSVLVKNMPMSLPLLCDFYKECLPALTGAIDARIQVLTERQSICQQTREVTDAIAKIRDKLVNLIAALNSKNGSILRLIESTHQTIDSQLNALGLEQQTHQQLKDFILGLLTSIATQSKDASSLNKDLASVTLSMQEAVSQQKSFIKMNKSTS